MGKQGGMERWEGVGREGGMSGWRVMNAEAASRAARW